jgi:hypothetical protein
MFEINLDDLAKAIEVLKEQRQNLEKVIRPYLSENLATSRRLNYVKLGSFLLY